MMNRFFLGPGQPPMPPGSHPGMGQPGMPPHMQSYPMRVSYVQTLMQILLDPLRSIIIVF